MSFPLSSSRAHFLLAPSKLFASGYKNRKLILRLAWREIESRYRSSVLGILWTILIPLLMLAVYTVVFSIIFQSRWGDKLGSRYEFSLVLFTGMICFSFFSECIGRAPTLMLENVSFIKKVVFPLDSLAWVTVLVALFNACVSFLVLLVAYVFVFGVPPITSLLIPVLLLPLILLTLSLTWILSSLGVYIRDVRQAVGVFITMLMFLTPIFYPLEAVPEKLRAVIVLNPLGYTLEWIRGALFWGQLPFLNHYLLALATTVIVAWLSLSWFEATKKGFADVL